MPTDHPVELFCHQVERPSQKREFQIINVLGNVNIIPACPQKRKLQNRVKGLIERKIVLQYLTLPRRLRPFGILLWLIPDRFIRQEETCLLDWVRNIGTSYHRNQFF